MRWNPQNPGQQLNAADINRAINQTGKMKTVIDEIPNAKLTFEIPVFKQEVEELFQSIHIYVIWEQKIKIIYFW